MYDAVHSGLTRYLNEIKKTHFSQLSFGPGLEYVKPAVAQISNISWQEYRKLSFFVVESYD